MFRLKYEALKEPFGDEKNLCNTLISYLQRYSSTDPRDDPYTSLPSPRDEQPEHPIGSGEGIIVTYTLPSKRIGTICNLQNFSLIRQKTKIFPIDPPL